MFVIQGIGVMTQEIKKGTNRRLRDYWRNLMESTQHKMSRGAQNIMKIISRARNENWRRSDRKEKK